MTAFTGRGQPPPLPKNTAEDFDGKYVVGRQIQAGLFEAEQVMMGRHVALKILDARFARSEIARARLSADVRAAARIRHPNVAEIHEFAVSARGTPYVAMELVGGETLADLIARRGTLPPDYACELTLQVLAGLGAAHASGLVHGNLKPANVVLTQPRPAASLLKILGFGLPPGASGGSSGVNGPSVYLAPEQALAQTVDARADLYAVGVVLYEMLAGVPPFVGTAAEILRQITSGTPRPLAAVNPAVPVPLAGAVALAMAKEPGQRLPTTESFAAHLAPYISRPPQAEDPLLRNGVKVPDVKIRQDGPRRALSRDFPAVALAKINGKPNGDVLSDSLLRSPVFPKAPNAPKIQLSSSMRETEQWPGLSDPAEEPATTAPGKPGSPSR